MSIEDNKRLVRRYLEEVVSAGNVEALPQFVAPDYGEAYDGKEVNLDRVVNGRIVEHGGAANLLEPLLAIGAIRAASDSTA